MLVRLRLPELLHEHEMTAYQLAKRSKGRISLSTAYRLVRQKGRVRLFDGEMLEAMCDVFDLQPGQLFERTARKRGH